MSSTLPNLDKQNLGGLPCSEGKWILDFWRIIRSDIRYIIPVIIERVWHFSIECVALNILKQEPSFKYTIDYYSFLKFWMGCQSFNQEICCATSWLEIKNPPFWNSKLSRFLMSCFWDCSFGWLSWILHKGHLF